MKMEKGPGRVEEIFGPAAHNILTVLLAIIILGCAAPPPAQKVVSDFSLLNIDGKTISTKNYSKARGFVVVFSCIHCPFAKLYTKRLNELNTKYSKLGIPLVVINSSDTLIFGSENIINMAKTAREQQYNFPYLFDPSQTVAKDFKAEKTPHAFVVWKENNKWIVKYSGAIDDNGAHPELVKTPYVANALNELLSNKPVSNPQGFSIGCTIHYRK